MSSTSSRKKRPKLSELDKYQPPKMRQLKVTAFFKRVTAPPNNKAPSNNINLHNSSMDVGIPENCDSDSDDCREIYCSENLLRPRQNMIEAPRHDTVATSISLGPPQQLAPQLPPQPAPPPPQPPQPPQPPNTKDKFDAADFVEFETFKYDDELLKDTKSQKERRRCPFYKRIPYTSISVDAFNFAREDSLKYYFLSHFHADHYIGLTKGFDRHIYCSHVTGRLIKHKFGVAGKYIHTYGLNEPFYVNDVRCTFFDANHCPGAVIILFELPNLMRYLHTGDFRANPEMELIPDLKEGVIDACFLDTTFCDATKTFPSQQEVIDKAVNVCREAMNRNPQTLIVCGSYCIGKEKVFLAVAEALDCKVWCSKTKRGYFNCVQDPRLDRVLVDRQIDAKIHVLPLKTLWTKGLLEHASKHYPFYEAIVALRPSGWEYRRNKDMIPTVEDNISIYPVAYSEHSSYTDLERFITWLRPRRIIPTVNMGDPVKRGQMNLIFKRWLRSPYVNQSRQHQPQQQKLQLQPKQFDICHQNHCDESQQDELRDESSSSSSSQMRPNVDSDGTRDLEPESSS